MLQMNVKMVLSRIPKCSCKVLGGLLQACKHVHTFLKAWFSHVRNASNELVMTIKVNALCN